MDEKLSGFPKSKEKKILEEGHGRRSWGKVSVAARMLLATLEENMW
jgi:hypothetical protein